MGKITEFIKEHEKVLRFIGVFLVIAAIAVLLQPILLRIIQSNPDLNATYEFIRAQLNQLSILWLFIIVIFGTLFFMSLPVDFLFLFYLINGADPLLTIIAMFFGVIIGRTINFWFGSLFREYTKTHVFGKSYKKFHERFQKWGSKILLFGNFIPFFPMEQFNVFVGTTKYGFKKFLAYQMLGKIIKLVVIWIGIYFIFEKPLLLSSDLFFLIRHAAETIIKLL